MADQVTTNAKSMVERLFDPKIQDTVTKRGRALVAALGDAAEMASERATTGWRDAEPMRRDAARAGRDALRWGNRTWRQEMLPGLNRLWDKRTVAIGAAGAAVPVAKELIDDAAVRMGIRTKREPRHWGAFIGGLLLGAIGGLIAAILTAPKAGREMRDELAVTAKDAAARAREVASTGAHEVATGAREVAARALDAAATASEWVPIFQRPEAGDDLNGETLAEPLNIEATAEPIVEGNETSEIAPPAPARKRTPKTSTIDEVE
ncbi:MAG: YtxH domain-containing protein [Chloroflexota bacterium]